MVKDTVSVVLGGGFSSWLNDWTGWLWGTR